MVFLDLLIRHGTVNGPAAAIISSDIAPLAIAVYTPSSLFMLCFALLYFASAYGTLSVNKVHALFFLSTGTKRMLSRHEVSNSGRTRCIAAVLSREIFSRATLVWPSLFGVIFILFSFVKNKYRTNPSSQTPKLNTITNIRPSTFVHFLINQLLSTYTITIDLSSPYLI